MSDNGTSRTPFVCPQELCRNWAGDGGCICRVMDLEPDVDDQDEEQS